MGARHELMGMRWDSRGERCGRGSALRVHTVWGAQRCSATQSVAYRGDAGSGETHVPRATGKGEAAADSTIATGISPASRTVAMNRHGSARPSCSGCTTLFCDAERRVPGGMQRGRAKRIYRGPLGIANPRRIKSARVISPASVAALAKASRAWRVTSWASFNSGASWAARSAVTRACDKAR